MSVWTPQIKAPVRISGVWWLRCQKRSLTHVYLISVYRKGNFACLNAVLPTHSFKGKVVGAVPVLPWYILYCPCWSLCVDTVNSKHCASWKAFLCHNAVAWCKQCGFPAAEYKILSPFQEFLLFCNVLSRLNMNCVSGRCPDDHHEPSLCWKVQHNEAGRSAVGWHC